MPDRRASTLLPIIQAHIKPRTTVKSDQYSKVAQLPNVASHVTVNHNLHFLDPNTGSTHKISNHIGRESRISLNPWEGYPVSNCLDIYLDEYMWRERYGRTKIDAFNNIIYNTLTINILFRLSLRYYSFILTSLLHSVLPPL